MRACLGFTLYVRPPVRTSVMIYFYTFVGAVDVLSIVDAILTKAGVFQEGLGVIPNPCIEVETISYVDPLHW